MQNILRHFSVWACLVFTASATELDIIARNWMNELFYELPSKNLWSFKTLFSRGKVKSCFFWLLILITFFLKMSLTCIKSFRRFENFLPQFSPFLPFYRISWHYLDIILALKKKLLTSADISIFLALTFFVMFVQHLFKVKLY